MTTKQFAAGTGFTRCAVCKIDLKGRFVYLDEKIESLLGYTKEELFGKSFLEFLDEPSQVLIESLLAQRNHYETFYDTTTMNLLSRSGESLTMRVVVSLNFIAGNPVNYQLIIDHDGPVPEAAQQLKSADYRAFVSELSQMGSLSDWKELLQLLCRFVGARQACLYLVTESSLEPRSAVSVDASGGFVFNSVPEPGMLHKLVAETGEDYSFLDQESVQRMVEQCGSAPNEFVARLQTSRGEYYVMRLVFAEEISHDQAQTSICDARLALGLFTKLLENDTGASGQSYNIKFTVGFLDALAIPAFLTAADGAVIGYNPSALRLFSEEQLEDNYYAALSHYSSMNSQGVIDSVVDYLSGAGVTDDFIVELKVSASEKMRLSVMKLSDEKGDLSGCFVFVPEASSSDGALLSDEDNLIWRILLRQLRQDLKSTEAIARQLGHEFYNQLGDTGNANLERLCSSLRAIRYTVRDLSRFVRLMASREPIKLVDLNLVVAEQMRQLLQGEIRENVQCTYQNLPKIKAHEDRLGYVLANVLSNSIRYNDKSLTEIKIWADLHDGICRMSVSDNGIGIGAKHLSKVFEPLYRAPDKKVKAVEGRGLGLTLAREMITAMGGDISITSTLGEGSEVKINLPVE